GGAAAVGFESGAVALYDVETLVGLKWLGKHEAAVAHLAFHRSARRLASSCEGAVKVWDVERGQEGLGLAFPKRTDNLTQLLFVGDDLLANGASSPGRLVRWDGSPVPAR